MILNFLTWVIPEQTTVFPAKQPGKQPKLGILFRGKGRMTVDKKSAYHESVNIFFQTNAWIYIDICRKWIDATLSTFVKDEKLEACLLLLGNLSCQESDEFKGKVSAIKGLCWYGLKERTGLWQPMDAGYVDVLKKLVGIHQGEWLRMRMQIASRMARLLVLKNIESSFHTGLEKHEISCANLSVII